MKKVAIASCFAFVLATAGLAFETLVCIKAEDLRAADETRTLSTLSSKVFTVTNRDTKTDFGDSFIFAAAFSVAWSHDGVTVGRRDVTEIEDSDCLDRVQEMEGSRDRDARMEQIARKIAQGEVPGIPNLTDACRASAGRGGAIRALCSSAFFQPCPHAIAAARPAWPDRRAVEAARRCAAACGRCFAQGDNLLSNLGQSLRV